MTDEEIQCLLTYAESCGLCVVATRKDSRLYNKVPTFIPGVYALRPGPQGAPDPIPRLLQDLPSMGLSLAKKLAWADIMD